MSTNKIVANAVKAMNGAYDTLIIRKDSKYNNLWCVYQDGSTIRAVSRVFDSPAAAKKYIKEKMPAWSDAKIKVKNSVATNAHKDGYNRIIQSFNKLVDAYYDVVAAVNAVPGAKDAVLPEVKKIYKSIGDAHADIKKWDAE